MEEFTFLLPRPQWQPDEVSRYCKRCHVNFSLFNRKHHCRHCGLIYCNTCCSRKTSLRQLGYQDPVKVCEDCFEVAYLISYVLQLESKSTQLHGARGLLALLANKDESQIKMFIQNGVLDAFIFLSQKSLSPELHLLSTIALRFLIENEYLKFFLQSNASNEHSGKTFKRLIRTITSILEVYTLVPEIKGDDIGVYSIHRIIFNTILSASRIVLISSQYPDSASILISSRWLYFFLDGMEQAIYDCGYALRRDKYFKLNCKSPSLLHGLFDDQSDGVSYITPASSPSPDESQMNNLSAPPDDLWLIALELQSTAAKAIFVLCQSAIKYDIQGFNSCEIAHRLQHIQSLYQPYYNNENNSHQSSVKSAMDTIQNCIDLVGF